MIPAALVRPGVLNTIALRLEGQARGKAAPSSSGAQLKNEGGVSLSLEGRWQARVGDDDSWANFPIPPQFGASTDHILEMAPSTNPRR